MPLLAGFSRVLDLKDDDGDENVCPDSEDTAPLENDETGRQEKDVEGGEGPAK
jgi:hypothetical protein